MGYIKVQTSVPVAQLDRASASGVEGLAFESRRAYHFFCPFRCFEFKGKAPAFFVHSFGFYQNPAFPNRKCHISATQNHSVCHIKKK